MFTAVVCAWRYFSPCAEIQAPRGDLEVEVALGEKHATYWDAPCNRLACHRKGDDNHGSWDNRCELLYDGQRESRRKPKDHVIVGAIIIGQLLLVMNTAYGSRYHEYPLPPFSDTHQPRPPDLLPCAILRTTLQG